MKTSYWYAVSGALLALFLIVGGWYYYQMWNRIVWSMVDVSGDWQSGDAHLLELPTGHVVLIDTGLDEYARSELVPYLESRGVDRIDQLIVTHAHRNQYGGLAALFDHVEAIREVYFNLPGRGLCDAESSVQGCDYRDVEQVRRLIESRGASLGELARDGLLYHNEEHDIILEVVYAHDGDSGPVGRTDINGTSAILRLIYGTTTVLFASEVDDKVSAHLVDAHYFLDSRILAAPNKATGSAAFRTFLDAVDPEVLLVSDSAGQWREGSGEAVRRFAGERGLPTYVSGLHGNVVVSLARDGYAIRSEREPSAPQ